MIIQVTKCEHGVDLTERECHLCSQRTVTVSTPCERCKELETKLRRRDELLAEGVRRVELLITALNGADLSDTITPEASEKWISDAREALSDE